jgi:hypothetical protein
MVQPVQADHTSQSFANWLGKVVKSPDGAELQKKLDNLRESANHLEDTIKEASQILTRNSDDFGFSFVESLASQQLYQLLLIEWNQFQAENAMASVPIQHISKLIVSATIDKSGISDFVSNRMKTPDILFSVNSQLLDNQQFSAVILVPMVHGIAIGAP